MEASAGERPRRGDGRGRGRGRGRHRRRSGGGRGRGVYAQRHGTGSQSGSPTSSVGSSSSRPTSAQQLRLDVEQGIDDVRAGVPATVAAPTAMSPTDHTPEPDPEPEPDSEPEPEPEPEPELGKQPGPGTNKEAESDDPNATAEHGGRREREVRNEDEELRKTEEVTAASRIQAAHRGRQGRVRADGVRKRLAQVAVPPGDGGGNGDDNGDDDLDSFDPAGASGDVIVSEQVEKELAAWGPTGSEVWFSDKFSDDLFDTAHVVRLALRVGESDAALAHGAEAKDPSLWSMPQRAWAAPGHYPVLTAAQIKKLGNQRRRLEFGTLRYVQLEPLSTQEELQRLRTDATAAPPARSTTAGVGIERVPVLAVALKSALDRARTGSAIIASLIQAEAERANARDIAKANRDKQMEQAEVDAKERRSRAHKEATKAQVTEHERVRRHVAHQQKLEQAEQEKRRAFDAEMQQLALAARRGSNSNADVQAEEEVKARRTEEARRAKYEEKRAVAQADEQKRVDAYEQAKSDAIEQTQQEDDQARELDATRQAEYEATIAKHSEAQAKFALELDERLRKLDPVLSDLEEACQKACVGMIDMHGLRLSQAKASLTKLERSVEIEKNNVEKLASTVSGTDFGASVRPLRQRMDDVLHTALTKLPEAVKLLPSARESDPLTMKAATDDFLQWNDACLGVLVCTREVEQVLAELRQDVVLERQRQAEVNERHEMEHEERHTRVLVRIMKIRNKQQLQRKLFLSVCRREWHKACAQRVDDERRAKDAERAAKEAKEHERQRAVQRAEAERDARDARHHSPWQAVKDGCRIATLNRLIGEEAKRRRNQQGRVLTDADGNTKISGVAFHVDDPDHATGECLLRNACWWGHLHLVQYLLKMGSDPNRIDSACSRTTPLHEAARGGYADICAALLEAGARRDAADGGGDTPLHWAARIGHSSVVKVLLRLTPRELEIESTAGSMTPLWRSLEIRNHKGLRAADLARSRAVDSIMAGKMSQLPERQAAQAEAEADAKRRRQARRQKKRDALAAKRANDPAAAVSSEMALQEQQATLALGATTGSVEGRKKKKKKVRKKSVA